MIYFSTLLAFVRPFPGVILKVNIQLAYKSPLSLCNNNNNKKIFAKSQIPFCLK